MTRYEELEEMYEILEMEDEDGNAEEFFVIDSIELEETVYFLVIEANREFDYDEEVDSYIFKGTDIDGDDIILDMLDEGDEYEEIARLFEEHAEDDDEE